LRTRSFKESAESFSIHADSDDSIQNELPDRNAWTEDEKPATTQKLIRGEMNHCIREVVYTLPEDYRSVILLSEFEDMTDREIAEAIGISLGAVKIRLHRARAKLQEALIKTCNFERDEQNEFVCERKPFEITDIQPKK
jgi:RNA polymerase sigma factor (sigma-70 family)